MVYKDSESLLKDLHTTFKSSDSVEFKGSYSQAVDPLVSDKERVKMTIHDIWKATGYRFT
jgi:hypothetical protein